MNWRVFSVLTGLLLAELCTILWLNGGHFLYTLDDAYIHLALAAHIAHGHYGINAAEASAPASSVLWPFLLAPFAWAAWFSWLPLLINSACAYASTALLAAIAGRVSTRAEAGPAVRDRVALTIVFVLATNTVGLVFTGLEHSLQLLLTLSLLLGLVRFADGEPLPRSVWWVIVLGPLVRYENVALSLPALLYLFWFGQRRGALLAGALTAGTLASFSLWLVSRGLAPLPASVMAKSAVISGGSGLVAFITRSAGAVWSSLTRENRGVSLVPVAVALLFLSTVVGASRRRGLARTALASLLLHMAVGRYGWFHRYEIYVWAFTGLTVALCGPRALGQLLPLSAAHRYVALVGVLLLSAPYLGAVATTPWASHNIYLQQLQLRRIARAYAGPVAVNDLGLVALDSPHYVLDFGGLANAEVQRARATSDDGAWLERMAALHGVELILIYESWFDGLIPVTWRKVAELTMHAPCITPASDAVAIFARSEQAARRAREIVRELAPTLPAGATLLLHDAASTGEAVRSRRVDRCAE